MSVSVHDGDPPHHEEVMKALSSEGVNLDHVQLRPDGKWHVSVGRDAGEWIVLGVDEGETEHDGDDWIASDQDEDLVCLGTLEQAAEAIAKRVEVQA